MNIPNRVLGIDFSGGANAGDLIWIAVGHITGNEFRLEDCYPARDLPRSSADRDICLHALCHFVSTQGPCICGMDFPFGLPHKLIREDSWEKFVLGFGGRYQSPEDFKEASFVATDRCELTRATDDESETPFSPYNLRLFRQTFFGIRDLLAPLIRENLGCILPMQKPIQGKTWIVEVCPASTLKKLGLYYHYHYKGPKKENKEAREKILYRLETDGNVFLPTEALRSKVLDNKGGDALDCIIAAVAVLRSRYHLISYHPIRTPYALEGYVYS